MKMRVVVEIDTTLDGLDALDLLVLALKKMTYERWSADVVVGPERLYLSRRNLQTLISKLDRQKAGETTHCTLVKGDNIHPKFPQTMPTCVVTAVEDEAYYTDREAGIVHPADEPKGTNAS